MPDQIDFPLETILAGADVKPGLSVCPDGHLRVAMRTCWQPRALDPAMRSLICDWVEHDAE